MKLQELTFKAGVNVKQMSKTVKTTTVYPDYYFLIFSLSCFPLYRYSARPITDRIVLQKSGTYRFIDISTQHNLQGYVTLVGERSVN